MLGLKTMFPISTLINSLHDPLSFWSRFNFCHTTGDSLRAYETNELINIQMHLTN